MSCNLPWFSNNLLILHNKMSSYVANITCRYLCGGVFINQSFIIVIHKYLED